MELNMEYEPPEFYEFEVSPYLHSPSTTSGMPPPFPKISNISGIPSFSFSKVNVDEIIATENVKTALLAGAVLSFIFLISKDAHKAFMRRAHWIPCDFLVLSAFSIQLLSLLNAQNQALGFSSKEKLSIKNGDSPPGPPKSANWKDILMIHNSRTILCVFTAYVMPSMADRGLEHSWVRLAAFVITVFHHLSSQFYDARDNIDVPKFLRLWPRENEKKGAAYYVYATIISLCFILLILILACASVSVRSIERIVDKKISLVLKGEGEFRAEKSEEVHPHHHVHHPPHHHSCWWNVKINVNRADQQYHLHHVHDHSSLHTVEDAVLRAGKGDENDHHSWGRTVEDAELRVKNQEENHHCCWRTIEDAAVKGEKTEEERYRRHCHYCWRTVEDAVLKAWIIVRAYSVQPILARSALTAAAAIILTIQIVITIVGGLSKVLEVKKGKRENLFYLIATVVQCIFIFLGWSLIILRWATAVAYYQRSKEDSWLSGLQVEDYWTRCLRELRQAKETRLQQAKFLDDKIDELVSKKEITGTLPSILYSAAIWVQWLLVSFSKACWLASVMLFHNKLTDKLFSFMFRKHLLCVFEDYQKYSKILEDVQMLGETAKSLWVAHRKSIEKAKSLIIQGNEDGEYNCDDLVDFLSDKKTIRGLGLKCLKPYEPQIGLNFLCKKRPTQRTQQLQEESDLEKQQSQGGESEQFSDVSTKSWKMTAVSLLSIIVQLSPIYADLDKEQCSTSHGFRLWAVKDCLKAYSQAWEIIDFVEEADTEADRITSEAADMYFQAIQKKVEALDFPARNSRATAECVRTALEKLKKESKSNTESLQSVNFISPLVFALVVNGKELEEEGRPNISKGNDSTDWKASASGNAVYNLCDSIECNDGADVSELLKELQSSLADIINECVEKAQHLLLLKSREWALNRDETRMGKALYTAGKAKAIMEKLVCNNVAIVSCH